MLESVNTAISTILNGGAVRSYYIGDMELQKMSLSELTVLRDKLKAEISSKNKSFTYVEFKDPRYERSRKNRTKKISKQSSW